MVAPVFGVVSETASARARAWAKDLWGRLDRARTLGLAAETAFWLLLSLVPLAAVLGLVAARLSVANWADGAPLLSTLPPATRQFVAGELFQLDAWNEGAVGPGSAAMFLWLASSGVHSIFDSLELQAGTSRAWWRKRLIALVTCVGLSIVAAALALLGPGLSLVVDWLGSFVPSVRGIDGASLGSRAFGLAFSAAILFGFNCGIYRVGIPARHGIHMPIAPGAAVAVVLEVALGLVHSAYLASVGDGGAYVAGLAVVGVTMMGLYLFVTALLFGAVVNRKFASNVSGLRDPAL